MTTSPDQTTTDVDVLIIGSGFAGIGMAVSLKREGRRSFVILERAQDVGGTWRDNTYPGAACDIQSHLYSYSFRPNPNWSRIYAPQPEIHAYLQDTARDEGISPHVRFGANVTAADWDDAEGVWVVESTAGTFRARTLVSATGHLSDPVYPTIAGIDTFQGELFHSARWRHDVELKGKRVGVIGTGASSIQIVPSIQPLVGSLTVFQRSAPYVVPRRDREYTATEKGMFARAPETAQALRDELFWGNESRFPQRLQSPLFLSDVRQVALDHLHDQVADDVLRRHLTPDYEIGCKRILISNDYYPAVAAPNVALETSGIREITPDGVVTRSGEHIPLDVLIVATGFEAADLPVGDLVRGRDGVLLADHWAEGGRALACSAVAGFPNFFVMLGPNTGLGAGSIIFMVETQISYIHGAITYLLDEEVDIDPAPEAEDAFVEALHHRSKHTVWVQGGCSSWYLHPASGRLTTLWPDFMAQFRRENGEFSPTPYIVRERSLPAPASV